MDEHERKAGTGKTPARKRTAAVKKTDSNKGNASAKDGNFLAISILTAAILISGSLVYAFGPRAGDSPSVPSDGEVAVKVDKTPNIEGAPMMGDANAPVTIVEFSDYECPFCARFFGDSESLLREEYINTGKVRFVYKDYPLSIHPQAQKAAEAARCVGEELGNGGYFAMHDRIFEGQSELGVSNFKKWAREAGADGGRFDSCLDSGKYAAAVKADFDEGNKLGVNGTPTFFINDKMVVGALPYEAIKSVIDGELK